MEQQPQQTDSSEQRTEASSEQAAPAAEFTGASSEPQTEAKPDQVQTAPAASMNWKAILISAAIALFLVFCIAVGGVVSSIILFNRDASLKSQISDLNGKQTDLEGKLQSLQANDIAALQSKLTALTSGDVAALKGDVAALKEKTKDPGTIFKVQNPGFSYDYYERSYVDNLTVTCDDKASIYIVLIKITTGSSSSDENAAYFQLFVVKGSGKTTLYSGSSFDMKVDVVGFVKLAPEPK